jgi:EAL domain-containing protein (putative c-di-GMP-specific phosphodiesterase class I)
MEQCIRRADTVVRLGGDEFVIILFDQPTQTETIAGVIQKIMDTVSQRTMIGTHQIDVTCSMGISTFPNDGKDTDTLLMNADAAMYLAKELGRNNFQFFTSMLNTKIHDRLVMQEELRNAIARNEFLLLYQPQINLKTRRIIGMEALIRWQHPQSGLITPEHFITLAEETGLIVPIGDWVLRTACKQNKDWQLRGFPPTTVSVNVSARQFREKNLVERVAFALQESKLEARYLELELTESMIMRDIGQAIATMNQLNQMGVALSIDDFGTGYSSLSALKNFPIMRLKIDQSFVRDIHTDPADAAITKAMITLGHQLNLKVIAEGVETDDQLTFLRNNMCDEMQGYHFSKPISPQEIEKLFSAAPI